MLPFHSDFNITIQNIKANSPFRHLTLMHDPLRRDVLCVKDYEKLNS
jgi:hypothetical protein